jgi:hypothetical protein
LIGGRTKHELREKTKNSSLSPSTITTTHHNHLLSSTILTNTHKKKATEKKPINKVQIELEERMRK